MQPRAAHFVGSIGLSDVDEVFRYRRYLCARYAFETHS